MKLIQQIVLTVTWTELKSSNVASFPIAAIDVSYNSEKFLQIIVERIGR